MAKKINLGTPPPPELSQAAGPPPPSPGPSPSGGGGSDSGLGAAEDLGAAQGANLDYPELHVSGLDPESGIGDLPDEGDAHMHYKVIDRGKRTEKHGPHKGKERHHVSMEIHHMTPLGGASKTGSAQGDSDNEARTAAKNFFESEDQGSPEEEPGIETEPQPQGRSGPPEPAKKKKKPSETMSQIPG